MYEWLKAFHLIAVIFWMAGLLYLPRLFVYHSASEPGGELEAKMIEAAQKLMRIIMTPAMIVAFILGIQRKLFASGERPKSEKFFRRINEIPAIFTIIIVIMVIVKPF